MQTDGGMKVKLLKCLVDQIIALEFSDDNSVHPDFAVKMMESTAQQLSEVGAKDMKELQKLLLELSVEYPDDKHRTFVETLFENFGLDGL